MHVADLLRSQLRASDFAAYDDGNMIVLMPDTGSADAEAVFNRISRILKHDRAFNFSLSFVFGVASRASRDADMQLTVSQAQADMLKNKMRVDAEVHKSIIDSLREALRLSAFETEQHSLRVQSLCVKIAEKLNLPENEIKNLEKLALFHDIGKLSVPSEIINKPSPLTAEEMRIMQLHVINGYKIANVSEELAPVAREILCHHERWDGKGYPNGYAGEEIPYLSRIVTVADSFDVITHDRPYKFARPVQSALDEIRRNRGIQFDPAVVDAFLSLDFSKIKI
jgi:putative nucleotidyltransferase with HDIG domain